MNATVLSDDRFRQYLEAERMQPVQKNLFTGEPEAIRIDVA